MSIAFRKKDYQYDGDDQDYDDIYGEEEEELDAENFAQERHHKAMAVPSDWVIELFHRMKEISKFHAVEIFDKLEPNDLAEFLLNVEGTVDVYST